MDVKSLTAALSCLCVSKVVDKTLRSTGSGNRGAKWAQFPGHESEHSIPVETVRSPASVVQLDSKSQHLPVWSEIEDKALISFLLLYTDGAPVQGRVTDFGRTLGPTFRKRLTQCIVKQVGLHNFAGLCVYAL